MSLSAAGSRCRPEAAGEDDASLHKDANIYIMTVRTDTHYTTSGLMKAKVSLSIVSLS